MRVAIVEDENSAAELLEGYMARFGRETGNEFAVSRYKDGLMFLSEYTRSYDIVFMDIQMPHIDGIETARKLRGVDPDVALVFITNMSQYAIKGYEVEAVDFILKPVSYFRLKTLLLKLMRRAAKNADRYVNLRLDKKLVKVSVMDIQYVEVSDHILNFCIGGRVLEGWGTLSEVKKQLYEDCFVKCSSSVLVNLKYVQSVKRDAVTAAGKTFYLTRGYKKAFMDALLKYRG